MWMQTCQPVRVFATSTLVRTVSLNYTKTWWPVHVQINYKYTYYENTQAGFKNTDKFCHSWVFIVLKESSDAN